MKNVNNFQIAKVKPQPLTIITKGSTSDVAAILDPPLKTLYITITQWLCEQLSEVTKILFLQYFVKKTFSL